MKIYNNTLNTYKSTFKSFKKTQRLDKVLLEKSINGKPINVREPFIKEILANKELSSTQVIDFCGNGSSAIAFEMPDEKVIKFTDGNHFPFGRPKESFDVPIYKEGKLKTIHYYIEEKLFQHGIDDGFVSIMKDIIKEKGYKTSDLGSSDIHQLGISKNGKLYLLDPECARCKTIFHALWNKVKSIIK